MEKKTNYSIQTLLDSRSFLYVLLFIVTICFVSTYTKIYDVKLDMNGDNIHYYALGKALAEGKGFTNTISFSETPHTHFPPGYPVFVAGVMKFFPKKGYGIRFCSFFFCSWSTISILSGLWALHLFWQLSFIAVYSFSNGVMLCTKTEKTWKNPRSGKLFSNSYSDTDYCSYY